MKVSVFVVSLIPVKPEREEPTSIVKVRSVMVPDPESVPLSVTGPVTEGAAPIGKEQFALTVFAFVVC